MGDGLVDEFGGLKDNGQVPLDFAGPAAGEQGDGEGLRVQVMPQQKGAPVSEGRQGLPKGVAHVRNRHALLPVKIGLKGEDDHQAVGEAGQGADPVGAPGPDLGADVVQHRHPVVFGQAGHPEIEVGKIHQDDQVRPGRFQDAADAAQGLPDGGQVAHHFHETHHGQIRSGGENPHPLGGHRLAPHPEELSASGQHSRMAATSRAAWSSPEASPATTRMRGEDDIDFGGGGDGPMAPPPSSKPPPPTPISFLVYSSLPWEKLKFISDPFTHNP